MDNKLRIKLIFVGLLAPFLLSGCLIDQIGGAFSKPPEELEHGASKATRELIGRAYRTSILPAWSIIIPTCSPSARASVTPSSIHACVADGISNAEIPDLRSASGIKNLNDADREYVARLVRLIRAIENHGKYRVLGFDKHYNTNGSVNLRKTNTVCAQQLRGRACE